VITQRVCTIIMFGLTLGLTALVARYPYWFGFVCWGVTLVLLVDALRFDIKHDVWRRVQKQPEEGR
jgi:hypothetical protein